MATDYQPGCISVGRSHPITRLFSYWTKHMFVRANQILARSLVLACVLSLHGLLVPGTASSADQPNVVIIFIDDMGYGDVEFNGATGPRTPNLVRIAQHPCTTRRSGW